MFGNDFNLFVKIVFFYNFFLLKFEIGWKIKVCMVLVGLSEN